MNLNDYIGIPWVNRGRDRAGFDCWGLVLWVLAHEFGARLDLRIDTDATDPVQIMAEIERQLQSGRWQPAKGPIEAAVVLLDTKHIGIVCQGWILHAWGVPGVGQVTAHRPAEIRKYFRRIEYFTLCPA